MLFPVHTVSFLFTSCLCQVTGKKSGLKSHFLMSSELLVTGTDCYNIFTGQIENENALSLQTQIPLKIIFILKQFLYLSEMLPSRPSKAL